MSLEAGRGGGEITGFLQLSTGAAVEVGLADCRDSTMFNICITLSAKLDSRKPTSICHSVKAEEVTTSRDVLELNPRFCWEVMPEMQRMQPRHKKQQFSALTVSFVVPFLAGVTREIRGFVGCSSSLVDSRVYMRWIVLDKHCVRSTVLKQTFLLLPGSYSRITRQLRICFCLLLLRPSSV